MQTELIIVSGCYHKCRIELPFIDLLEEGGLVEVHIEGGEHYLLASQFPDVERYSRMHYNLSINMEGIDVIHHLLERMELMKREISTLRDQLIVFKREGVIEDW